MQGFIKERSYFKISIIIAHCFNFSNQSTLFLFQPQVDWRYNYKLYQGSCHISHFYCFTFPGSAAARSVGKHSFLISMFMMLFNTSAYISYPMRSFCQTTVMSLSPSSSSSSSSSSSCTLSSTSSGSVNSDGRPAVKTGEVVISISTHF